MKSKKGTILGMFAASLAILGISGLIIGKSMAVKGDAGEADSEMIEQKTEVFSIEEFEKEAQAGNNVFMNLKFTLSDDAVEYKCSYRLVHEDGKYYTEYISGENLDEQLIEELSASEKYDYILDLTGRHPCAAMDSRYILLSNTIYDFEAIGNNFFSSNSDDWLEDVKFLWIDEILL